MSLTPSIRYGDLDLTSAPYLWEYGADLGKPALVVEALEQQLQDGEVVASDRSSNREIVLTILVDTTDLAAQADAEAALALEAAKQRNTLTFDPGDGVAPVTVFDTFVAELSYERDDERELNNLRRWQLTIPALPFARSENLVEVAIPAPPASVTETVVDNGASLSGWAIAPSSGNVVKTYSASTTWTAPGGVTSATVEAEGAGGGGSGLTSAGSGGGGGGGGGAYASSVVAVTPGTGYAIVVGAGGAAGATLTNSNAGGAGGASSFGGTLVKAAGGSGAPAHSEPAAGAGGAGGTVAASIGTTRTAGGAGGGGYTSNGGFNVNGGAGGAAAAPLGSSAVGAGGSGDGDFTNAAAGKPGSVRLTYSGVWAMSLSGGIKATKSTDGNTSSWLERTGLSASTAGKPYVKVVTASDVPTPSLSFLLNGSPATVVAQSGGTYWLDASAISTLNSVRVIASTSSTSGTSFTVQSVSLSSSYQPGSTGRQSSRVIDVAGSARAPGSLALVDATPASLGSTLVYTCPVVPSMAQPPLRPFLVSGPVVTADTAIVSGSRTPLSTQHYFDVPAPQIVSGGHLLIARIRNSTTGTQTLSWATTARMGGVDQAASPADSGTVDVSLTANVWANVTIALLNLPPRKLGPQGIVRVALIRSAGTGTIELDDAWLFNVELGRLTWVEAGTGAPASGGAASRLWLDSASVDNPEPSISLGTSASRADAYGAGSAVQSFGVHEFVPPQVNVFTATSGSTAAEVDLSYYPRWHTHVGSGA